MGYAYGYLTAVQWGEGPHVYVQQAKWYLTSFITSMSCLPSGCQWSPFKDMASFAMIWVDSKQKTRRERSLAPCSSCIKQYDRSWPHLSWHMEGIVAFRGCSAWLNTFGACVLNDWADSHVWLGMGKEKNNTWAVCVNLFFARFLLFSPTPKRMNNIKSNQ